MLILLCWVTVRSFVNHVHCLRMTALHKVTKALDGFKGVGDRADSGTFTTIPVFLCSLHFVKDIWAHCFHQPLITALMLSRQLHPAVCKSRLVPHCLQGASHSVLVAVPTLNHNQTRHRQRRASCCAGSEDVAPLPQQQLSETEKDSVLQQLEQLRRSASLQC